MKKLILMAIVGLMAALPMQAQHYQNSRYYNPRTGRLDYRGGSRPTYRTRPASFMDSYYGFRVGPTFTTVSSDDPYLDGSSMKTGLNVGFAAGFGIVLSEGMNAYYAVDEIDAPNSLIRRVKVEDGIVPAFTPVIMELNGEDAALNKVDVVVGTGSQPLC